MAFISVRRCHRGHCANVPRPSDPQRGNQGGGDGHVRQAHPLLDWELMCGSGEDYQLPLFALRGSREYTTRTRQSRVAARSLFSLNWENHHHHQQQQQHARTRVTCSTSNQVPVPAPLEASPQDPDRQLSDVQRPNGQPVSSFDDTPNDALLSCKIRVQFAE